MAAQWQVAVEAANNLGEGVIWSPGHGEIQWTDIHGKKFWAHRPADKRTRSVNLPDRLCCFAALGGSRLLSGFAGGLETHDHESGERQAHATVEADQPSTRVNDGKLDRQGRLVFGTMDENSPAQPIGGLWSYTAGSAPRALREGVRIANSICFSPDGRRMYFADTPTRKILAFDYEPETGDIANERMFAELPGPGYPDGSTVDAEGFLWNAEWGGSRLTRYSPDGRIDRVLELPCSQVTCAAFGGEALDQLYVTSARGGLKPDALAREPLAGSLFVFETGVKGIADTPFANRY